ncbi:MAG TPA: EpsI family protein [Gemmatimonadaceae bacterium]|nr:EpsI family protein [Gemmatimonadaceae bacterium]
MRDFRAFVPAAILFVGCAFTWRARSQAAIPLAAPLTSIPQLLSGYRVENQTLSPDERAVAGMNDYVARSYWRDSTVAFTTLVTYYERQTQGKAIHSPKNCLPGAGWEVLTAGTSTVTADGVPHVVNHDVLKNGPATAVVYYWYQGRGRVVANEYRVKWNLLRDAAVAGHTEESLVRVVAFVAGGPPADSAAKARLATADTLGADVAGRLLSAVNRVLPGGS